MEILFVVLCGTICGAESWRDFVLFGKEKTGFLKKYFPYANGIPSEDTLARLFAVRAHWLIENALHWTLDVIFDEDNLRVRKKNAGQNMAIIRHVVFNMLGNANGIGFIRCGRYSERALCISSNSFTPQLQFTRSLLR